MELVLNPRSHHALYPELPATPVLCSYKPSDSYHNEAVALNPDTLDLVGHLQGSAPPLEEGDRATVGDLSRFVLDKLADSPSPPPASLQKLHRQLLLLSITAKEPGNLDKKEAQACYEYFKTAQHTFDEHARSCSAPQQTEYQQLRDLCRMLKWQFRASRDQRTKSVLDQALAKSRAEVAEGGSLGNRAKLGIGATALGGASIVPSLELSTKLETTQGRIIKDTTSVSAGVTAQVSLANLASSRLSAQVEKSTTRKYGDIDSYANARSLSKWTWWNGSKRDLLTQSRTLFASCNNYKRNIRLAAQSRPYLESRLRENGLVPPNFEHHAPQAQPFQVERGQRVALTAQAQFDGLGIVTAGAQAKADLLRTTKNKALDIIGVYDWSKDFARQCLGSPRDYDTSVPQLLSDLHAHIADSSQQLSRAVLRNESPQRLRQLGEEIDHRSRQLANDYIHLKLQGAIADDSAHDESIRQLFKEHALLLRPDSLKLYTAKTDTETRTIAVESKLKLAAGASAQASANISLSSVVEDDPHLSGTYLDITLQGQFNTLETLQNLISSGLAQAGVSGFDPAPIIALIAGTVLYQSHGCSAKFTLKIKDGKPVLLLSQQFLTQSDDFNQTVTAATPLALEVGIGSHVHNLAAEQLGSQSLDLVLPIALGKLDKGTEADLEAWDNYVNKHAQAFDRLLNNIANRRDHPLLDKELTQIGKHLSPAGRQAMETLEQAARKARDEPTQQTLQAAREAFKATLLAYIDDYYEAKVMSAWRIE
ncbi:hypothetical protein AB3464_11390 [Pseudomonas asplenii]|uniref:hypothetical protein n=1 Tax=Pseudomonas asplenii TaxID=53407 RepID=UPI0037C7855E